jgi:hypothetical protein
MNSIWIFGDSAGIDFTNITTPIPIVSSTDGRGSCVSISDSLGSLQMYATTQGYLNSDWVTRIFNPQNQIVQGCDSITGEGWYNELITVPRPDHSNQYYVFSVGLDLPNNQGCYYSLVDMSLNGGLGAMVLQNIQINNLTSGDCLTAVKHGNGRDWWVINKYSSQTVPNHYNRFFIYLVTGDSIHAPIIQDFNDATDGDAQKIIWNPSSEKFMLINTKGYMSEFDFDRCTGTIALNRNIFPEQTSNYSRYFWEGAYSPNDSIFYVSTSGIFVWDTLYLLQYDLTAGNIPTSCDTLETFIDPITPGAVRLAPDGKIYFSRGYNWGFPGYPYPDSVRNTYVEYLSVINSPNNLGAGCNYQPFSFYLGGKRTYYGLPNNPNYELGPDTGSICDTLLFIGQSEIPQKKSELDIFYHLFLQTLFIKANNLTEKNLSLTIFDITGRKLFQADYQTTPPHFTTDLPCNYTRGIYLLTLTTPTQKRTTRFIIQ